MTTDLTTVGRPTVIKVWLDWGMSFKRLACRGGRSRFRYVFVRSDGIRQIGGVDAYNRLDALNTLKKQYKLPEHIELQLVSSLGDL